MKRLAACFILFFLFSWGHAQSDISIYRKNGEINNFKNAQYENRKNNSYITDENNKMFFYPNGSLDSITGLPEGVLYFKIAEKIISEKVHIFEISEKYPQLINQFIVLEKSSMSVEDGYKLVKEWINLSFNDPVHVIKSDIENKYIRIKGIGGSAVCFTSAGNFGQITCQNLQYTLSFKFKENKIKFEILKLEIKFLPGQILHDIGWNNYNPRFEDMVKNNGRKHTAKEEAAYSTISYLSVLANEIQVYLENPLSKKSSNDDW